MLTLSDIIDHCASLHNETHRKRVNNGVKMCHLHRNPSVALLLSRKGVTTMRFSTAVSATEGRRLVGSLQKVQRGRSERVHDVWGWGTPREHSQ